jgi:hypothetical protein
VSAAAASRTKQYVDAIAALPQLGVGAYVNSRAVIKEMEKRDIADINAALENGDDDVQFPRFRRRISREQVLTNHSRLGEIRKAAAAVLLQDSENPYKPF